MVELLIAFFIIGTLSTVILLNYRSGQEQASLTRAAAAFETSMRKAQNLAVASSEFEGSIPCGYGLHYLDDRNYSLYVGQRGGAARCEFSNRNYQSGLDSLYESVKVIEPKVVFKNSFPDIFFEPPDPATYIDNSRAVGVSTLIEVCLESNLSVCRGITIDTAGRIIIQ